MTDLPRPMGRQSSSVNAIRLKPVVNARRPMNADTLKFGGEYTGVYCVVPFSDANTERERL